MTDEFVVDFPTLGDLGDAWITRHCRVPQGFTRGRPFEMADWQFWCHANRYRVRPETVFVPADDVGPDNPPTLNQAFHFRRTLIVAPQKTGKGPNSAANTAFEACGPSVFGGWAEGGEVYRCRDFGCPCGWGDNPNADDTYIFQEGEPLGIRHPSPLIQITANSADQADNIYGPLRAMIALGPLKELLAVRENFIRILGLSGIDDLDRIDVVTASARSRLGNPISDAEQDEAGLYTAQNKMVDVADTQARGAAGMGGRTHLTTNAWDPSENSYAQQIFELREPDVFIFYRDPNVLVGKDGKPLKYARQEDRKRIHEHVYQGSWWVNLASIEADAVSLMKRDPTQAERFFGNRMVNGSGHWMPSGAWKAKKSEEVIHVAPRTAVAGGFDGSDNEDYTGIRLETLDGLHQFTPTYGAQNRKTLWRPEGEPKVIPRAEVMIAFREIVREFEVVRFYLDPYMWGTEIDDLGAEFGDHIFVKWSTTRVAPMHAALERFRTDVTNTASRFSHDGDEDVETHIGNAVMRTREMNPLTKVRQYILGKPVGEDHRKIDYAMSSVLAHEAAMDAIAAGWQPPKPRKIRVYR